MHLVLLRDNFYIKLSDNRVLTCFPFHFSGEYISGLLHGETEILLDKKRRLNIGMRCLSIGKICKPNISQFFCQ